MESIGSSEHINALGVLGCVLYMLAYGLLQLGLMSGTSLAYTILNMLAALFVLVSLVDNFNLASVLIQVAWILISVIGLFRIAMARRKSDDLDGSLSSL